MPKTLATDAFIATCKTFDERISALRKLADDHFGVDPDAVNWGHVGVVAHANEELREILEFLTGQPLR